MKEISLEKHVMKACDLCLTLDKKSSKTKPHEFLENISATRTFNSAQPKGFVEEDFQCCKCRARLTHSTNKNDFGWTLWRG